MNRRAPHVPLVAATVTCLAIVWRSSEVPAYNGTEPLTKEEAIGFLGEAYLAKQRCDDQWFDAHLAPHAQLMFEATGQDPITVERDDYLETFHQHCRYRIAPPFYDKGNTSFETRRGDVVIRQRFNAVTDSFLVFLYVLEPLELESLEQTVVLSRSGGMIKADRVQVIGIPVAEPATTSRSRPRS